VKEIGAYNISVRQPEGTKQLVRPRCEWENDITVYVVFKGLVRIEVTGDNA
jgi:hypothetical protein